MVAKPVLVLASEMVPVLVSESEMVPVPVWEPVLGLVSESEMVPVPVWEPVPVLHKLTILALGRDGAPMLLVSPSFESSLSY